MDEKGPLIILSHSVKVIQIWQFISVFPNLLEYSFLITINFVKCMNKNHFQAQQKNYLSIFSPFIKSTNGSNLKSPLNIENTWGFKVPPPSVSQNELFENVLLVLLMATKLYYRFDINERATHLSSIWAPRLYGTWLLYRSSSNDQVGRARLLPLLRALQGN